MQLLIGALTLVVVAAVYPKLPKSMKDVIKNILIYIGIVITAYVAWSLFNWFSGFADDHEFVTAAIVGCILIILYHIFK